MLAFASTVVATQNTTTALQTIGLQQATSQRLEGRKTRANMTPEDMAKLKVQRLDKIVSLTDDQKAESGSHLTERDYSE